MTNLPQGSKYEVTNFRYVDLNLVSRRLQVPTKLGDFVPRIERTVRRQRIVVYDVTSILEQNVSGCARFAWEYVWGKESNE